MSQYEDFTLKEHMIDFFNQNAEFFNDPKSEEKVFATEKVGRIREELPCSGEGEFPDVLGPDAKFNISLVVTEKIELPVMTNPKYFFRFYKHEKLQAFFDACPAAVTKLGTRPWKYILMYSPEYVEQCPCLKDFSQAEKELILRRRPELEKHFQ